MEVPESAGTQAGYRPAPDPEIVANLGRYGIFHREPRKMWRPTNRQLLVLSQQPVEVHRGAKSGQQQVRKVRHQLELEEFQEDSLVHVIAFQIVDSTPFVGVEYRRARLIHYLVACLHHPFAPPYILSEVRLLVGQLLPNGAAQTRAYVVEESEATAFPRRHLAVAL